MNDSHRYATPELEAALRNPERKRTGNLGPNGVAWARKNIRGFRGFKADADRAQKHAERVKAKVQQ